MWVLIIEVCRNNGMKACSVRAIEEELERAIYKAGGIHDKNFDDLQKIRWAKSSRTDKGVHSLASTISLKMEIPMDAWNEDPTGIMLANIINSHLPENIKVFSVLPVRRGFNPRRQCILRKYTYLIPGEIIGVQKHLTAVELGNHIKEFNSILMDFEGRHPFHNYTVRSGYRKQSIGYSLGKHLGRHEAEQAANVSSGEVNDIDGHLGPMEMHTCLDHMSQKLSNFNEDTCVEICDGNDTGAECERAISQARWLHENDDSDNICSSYFRNIMQCSCSDLKKSYGLDYIEVSISGESFMLRQIRKMIGTAVAVKRGILPRDTIKLSLSKFARIVLPLAPSEVLILSGHGFMSGCQPGELVEDKVQVVAEAFYRDVIMPEISMFLDPSEIPWKNWFENLEMHAQIPDQELEEVRKAWTSWKNTFEQKYTS